MANEIRISHSMMVLNGPLKFSQPESFQVDMTGIERSGQTQTVTEIHDILYVSAEVVEFGWAWFKNHSDVYTIQVGLIDLPEYGGNFAPFLRILPGESFVCPIETGDLAARTTIAGDAVLEYHVFAR